MILTLKEVLEPQNSDNDDLPQNEKTSGLNRNYEGDFDPEVEPSHYSLDIWSYADNPTDSE